MKLKYWWVSALWLVLAGGCSDAVKHVVNGEPAPAFALPALVGGALSSVPPGKVVAVRFWADWCPFCESEMRAIEPVYQTLQPRGLVILAVNVRQDRETAQAFIDKINISYDVLLDEEGSVARAYGVVGLPTTFFIGRDGRVVGRILGESAPEVFAQQVEPLL